MSVAELLQVYKVPFAEFPVAPAGAQKAPGLTVASVAVGVGVALGDGATETVGDVVGVGVDVGTASLVTYPSPQRLLFSLIITASSGSTESEYLLFVITQPFR